MLLVLADHDGRPTKAPKHGPGHTAAGQDNAKQRAANKVRRVARWAQRADQQGQTTGSAHGPPATRCQLYARRQAHVLRVQRRLLRCLQAPPAPPPPPPVPLTPIEEAAATASALTSSRVKQASRSPHNTASTGKYCFIAGYTLSHAIAKPLTSSRAHCHTGQRSGTVCVALLCDNVCVCVRTCMQAADSSNASTRGYDGV